MQSRSLDLLDALFSRSDCNLNSLNKCIFFIEVLDFLGYDWTNDLGIEVLHIFHELNPKEGQNKVKCCTCAIEGFGSDSIF